MNNRDKFLKLYKENLIKSVIEKPDHYAWPLSELDLVFERMASAIDRGSFNKESPAFKATCKALGLKHTYTEINKFIKAV